MNNTIPNDIIALVKENPHANVVKKHATQEQLQWFQDHNTTPYIVSWFIDHGLKSLDGVRCHYCGKPIVYASNNQYRLKRLIPGYAFCSPECAAKDPIKKQRIKTTNLERYGCEHVTQNEEIYNRKRATSVERYGENYGKILREKASQTNIERYGATTLFHAPGYKQQNLEKYRTHFYDSFVELLFDKRIELVTSREEYIKGCQSFTYRCIDCGKIWTTHMHDVYHMNVCTCHTTNVKELALFETIQTLYHGKIIQHDRSVLGNKRELDIILPDIKVAFEFNGCFWHSTKFRSDHLYHQQKALDCAKQGFCLYQIFEDQWIYNRDSVIDKIYALINKTCRLPEDNIVDLDYNIIPMFNNVAIAKLIEPKHWYAYVDKRYDADTTEYQSKYLHIYDSGKAVVRRK